MSKAKNKNRTRLIQSQIEYDTTHERTKKGTYNPKKSRNLQPKSLQLTGLATQKTPETSGTQALNQTSNNGQIRVRKQEKIDNADHHA